MEAAAPTATDTLAALPPRYETATHLLYGIGSPTGRFDHADHFDPRSRPPPGVDQQLRAALIECARAIALAHEHLAPLKLKARTWAPDLGYHVTRPYARELDADGNRIDPFDPKPVGVVAFGLYERWYPDGSDPAIRVLSPDYFEQGCRWLSFALDEVASRGWLLPEHFSLVKQARRQVGHARGLLERAGAWDKPKGYPADEDRCARPECYRLRQPDRRHCASCRPSKRRGRVTSSAVKS